MSKAKHTKGFWYILPTPEVNLIRTEGEKGHTYIAKVIKDPDKDNKGLNTNEGRGNAHLIAAAPEMYEALEEVLNYWTPGEAHYEGQDFFDAIGHLQALLKKARGEL